MNKAKLNGQIIYASEIMMDYKLENEIRDLSRAGKLMCPDGCCDSPVLKYCHGKKRKQSYFSHRNTCSCDYDKYDKKNTDTIDNIKNKLYERLISNGINCDIDVKVFNRHYAHVAIYENNATIAIELVSDSLGKRKTNDLVSLYKDKSISVIFVVVGSDNQLQAEFEANYIRRYSLNESKDNNLLIISSSGEEIYQYRYDTFTYVYRGRNFAPSGDLYRENSNFNSLVFENGSLTIEGFEERYNDWFNEKQKKFEELKITKLHPIFYNVDNESTISESVFIPQKQVFEFDKNEHSAKKRIDKEIIKSKEELQFIETVPIKKHRSECIWSKKTFMEKIYGVCYNYSRPSFQLLMNKFNYVTLSEKEILVELFEEFTEKRPDYLYILETALKRSKE